ncbi:alpha/beta hydrolase-fold protein [Streptomyces sp. NPDC057623]|uniref:alpha/beta hydrolase-fold protein n=1 Tax=Streptomyces sp. NPDC057623 TaxID=3346187 RepID=UPI0036C4A9FA
MHGQVLDGERGGGRALGRDLLEPLLATGDYPITPGHFAGITTVPLPSGTFSYGFYVNCTTDPQTGCTRLQDPSNPSWDHRNGSTPVTGSPQTLSQVYVPSDERFGTEDLSWQAPRRTAGKLVDLTYPSPQSSSPVGEHTVAVYTSPGYDPNRETPYPTLYLSHGAGGNDLDWSTQGVANRILDNLYADGKIQPMVVVMTNFNGLSCDGSAVNCYRADLLQNVIPFIESRFNVSHRSDDRAFAGLSAGGMRANDLLFNATEEFGYFGSWSLGGAGAPPVTDPRWQNPALRTRLGLFIGGGRFDASHMTQGQALAYQANLTAQNIPYVNATLDGVHSWAVWRELLRRFATDIVFKTTRTTLAHDASDRKVVATVSPATTQPEAPSGRVQFYVDGVGVDHAVGPARRVGRDGTVTLPGLGGLAPGPHTVTAVYSGDHLYRTSTSASLTIS